MLKEKKNYHTPLLAIRCEYLVAKMVEYMYHNSCLSCYRAHTKGSELASDAGGRESFDLKISSISDTLAQHNV